MTLSCHFLQKGTAGQRMLFDAHWHGFRVFEGVPNRGIYDNMKTAVDRIGVGKKRDVNARFLSMTSHYVFEPEFCNPAAGWGKPLVRHWFKPNGGGQIEKNVQDAPLSRMQTCAAGQRPSILATHARVSRSDGA